MVVHLQVAEFDKTITLNNNFTQVRASVEKPVPYSKN